MSNAMRQALPWSPRVLGLLASAFIGLFALDAFSQTTGFLASLPDFFIHLIPALLLLGTVIAAWRRESLGALVFLSLAIFYAANTLHRPDWILAISGPLALVGAIYGLVWWLRRSGKLT
jgi:hypothetical protein